MERPDKILIDRYLADELTGVELQEFLDRLERDVVFRKNVSFREQLIDGIRIYEDERLETLIRNKIHYHRPAIPVALKFIFVFLVLTAGGIVFWNYTGPDTIRQKYFSFNFLNREKKSQSDFVAGEKQKNIEPVISHSEKNIVEDQEAIVDTGKVAEDIIVKKDQLLISISMKPVILDKKDSVSTEKNLSESAIQKLNPEGSLPDKELINSPELQVEFWVSPVNYKGYRFTAQDRLVLFGIDEPDAVQLYSMDKKIWMKYGQEYFCLERFDDFEAFNSSMEIPSALR